MCHSPATLSPSLALESAKLLEIIGVNMSNATSAPPSSLPFSFKQFNDLIAGIEGIEQLDSKLECPGWGFHQASACFESLIIPPRSGDEIDRWVAKKHAIEIILHFSEYHATMGGIYKSKS